jgi:hypothetical protein
MGFCKDFRRPTSTPTAGHCRTWAVNRYTVSHFLSESWGSSWRGARSPVEPPKTQEGARRRGARRRGVIFPPSLVLGSFLGLGWLLGSSGLSFKGGRMQHPPSARESATTKDLHPLARPSPPPPRVGRPPPKVLRFRRRGRHPIALKLLAPIAVCRLRLRDF